MVAVQTAATRGIRTVLVSRDPVLHRARALA